MDWITAQADPLQSYFVPPHPIAVAAVVGLGLFWARVGPRLAAGRPGAWFGFVAGAAAYAPAQLWVRGEPTRAVADILQTNIGVERLQHAQPALGIVEALIAGYADEFVKLLLMLVVIFAMGYPRDPASAATAGLAPAAGFGLFAANHALTAVLTGASLDASLAYPFIHQAAWVALHFGTGYLLAKGWLSGRLSAYLLYAGLLHAAAAYTVTLDSLGWHPLITTLILAAVALATFTGGAGAIPRRR